MKYLLPLLAVFFLCPACKTASKQASAPAESRENALLWEISGNGLAGPSWLYGTIHMICAEDFTLGDSLRSGFSSAEKIYLELDMDDPSMALRTLQLSMLKKGSLKDLMSREAYDTLNRFMTDSMRMPLMLFNKMKPFTLMSILYTKILPCDKTESYEQQFLLMAAREKKEILGLEKLEDQFAVFDQIPDSVEAQMILAMIRDFDGQRREFQKMTDAYKNRDLNTLAGLMEESPDMKGYENLLLANRNKNWIPVMQSAMAKNPCFFAVGAGHLPGPEGVIALLRRAGYRVRPIE
jgi:uncharacterized protein YbaP (TraB family)